MSVITEAAVTMEQAAIFITRLCEVNKALLEALEGTCGRLKDWNRSEDEEVIAKAKAAIRMAKGDQP